jgi:hypothetical protein
MRGGPQGPAAARYLALLIVVLSGLAVLPLLAASFVTIGYLSPVDQPAMTRGLLLIGWMMAALLVVGWNLFHGMRVMNAPSWRGVGGLILPTLLLLLAAVPLAMKEWAA